MSLWVVLYIFMCPERFQGSKEEQFKVNLIKTPFKNNINNALFTFSVKLKKSLLFSPVAHIMKPQLGFKDKVKWKYTAKTSGFGGFLFEVGVLFK